VASQGPNYPALSASSAVGSEAFVWTNPSNVSSDNGGEAVITAATFDSPVISDRLVNSRFSFTVPADAVSIDGVQVEIERRNSAGAASDNRVQLLNELGAIAGNNNADTATDWPATASIVTYGSATTTWGLTLTPTIVNDADFGVTLSAQADAANTDIQVDFIRMTVFYTPNPAGAVPISAYYANYYSRMVA
jgi:hypothetical protein